jgi:aspartate/methionine/tyrosine aminotransferase
MRLNPFKLERYFARYEFKARYLLGSSDCESLTVGELLALEPMADRRFHAHWLGYTESPGAPGLRREISRIYTAIQPEQVLVFSGAEEAIFLLMHAALAAGDHVIVHWPCYQSLSEIAAGLGCEMSLWRARPENNWALDLDELERAIRPNTRLIVVNTPHNPTGYLMSQPDFRRLNQIAQQHGVRLFSDEVYRESEHDPSLRLPAACDLSESAVSLGVTSKTYGLPGLRIGWIATRDAELCRRMAALKDYTTICNSAPSEFLAELALRHREELAERSRRTILKNLTVLDEFFTRHTQVFVWQRPQAGPIAFPRLLGEDVEDFCRRLVEQAGVMLLPGTLYDHPGNHFRIGFGRKNLPEAVERLEEFLKS